MDCICRAWALLIERGLHFFESMNYLQINLFFEDYFVPTISLKELCWCEFNLFLAALKTINTTLKCISVDREDCVDKKAAF